MEIIFIFILGLIFGSFINAVVYRLPAGKSLGLTRSICPCCQTILSWYDLIPLLSFILLKGKCRQCQAAISWQYPLVELATGALFVLVYVSQRLRLGETLGVASGLQPLPFAEAAYFIGFFIIVVFLLIIFLYDFKHYLILDRITLPAMAVALIWHVINSPAWSTLLNLMLAAVVGGGFFLLQFIISQGKWIGGGDIRLGALMGFILGWPNVVVGLMLAYVIGAVFSIFMLLLKKKQWGSKIPFGTFLTVGTLLALLWADKLIAWYLGFL